MKSLKTHGVGDNAGVARFLKVSLCIRAYKRCPIEVNVHDNADPTFRFYKDNQNSHLKRVIFCQFAFAGQRVPRPTPGIKYKIIFKKSVLFTDEETYFLFLNHGQKYKY